MLRSASGCGGSGNYHTHTTPAQYRNEAYERLMRRLGARECIRRLCDNPEAILHELRAADSSSSSRGVAQQRQRASSSAAAAAAGGGDANDDDSAEAAMKTAAMLILKRLKRTLKVGWLVGWLVRILHRSMCNEKIRPRKISRPSQTEICRAHDPAFDADVEVMRFLARNDNERPAQIVERYGE